MKFNEKLVMLRKQNNLSQDIVSGTTVTDKSSTELKETISKAELTIDRTTFSATESNELIEERYGVQLEKIVE